MIEVGWEEDGHGGDLLEVLLSKLKYLEMIHIVDFWCWPDDDCRCDKKIEEYEAVKTMIKNNPYAAVDKVYIDNSHEEYDEFDIGYDSDY